MNTKIVKVEGKTRVIVSTIETPELTGKRRDGNTTKQVDFAIQCLFMGFIVKVEDHSNSRQGHKHLHDKILKRLHIEHNLGESLIINNDKISLK